MWFWIISNIIGSLLGAASAAYIKDTKVGKWVYAKVAQFGNWMNAKYDIDIFDKEQLSWKRKYPVTSAKLEDLEKRVRELEK